MDTIIFDLDDTLIVEETAARRAVTEALAFALGPRPAGLERGAREDDDTEAVVEAMLACARRHWYSSSHSEVFRRLGIASWEGLWATFAGCHRSLDGIGDWAPTYRRLAWEDTLRALGADPDLAGEVSERYIDAQRRGHPPIASAVEAARSAARSTPIAVLTNGPPDIQRLKLGQVELEIPAEAVVISGETGVGKPDPRAFTLALDSLGAPAAGTVMIGDSWERDVLGALRAGMRAVWISGGRPPPESIDGVLVVDRLTPETLGRL